MAEHKFRRGGVAVLGVIALGASAFLGSNAATAAPETYDFGNVDGTHEASLTVHKYEDQAAGGATGHPDGTVEGDFKKPLKDVVFTAYPLQDAKGSSVDLTAFAGWNGLNAAATAVSQSTACEAPTGYKLGKPGVEVGPTNDLGEATADLPVGAYVVCETSAPSTVTKRSNPFLVTLPLPVSEGTPKADKGWLYDVHVFPKNSVTEFKKTINEQVELGEGAKVDFTITGAIPDITPDEWTEFTVTDKLDERLDAASTPATLVAPAVAPNNMVIEYDATTRQVIVRFKDKDWLKQNAGTKFEIVVHTTVNAAGVTGIDNTAQQWVNNPGQDPNGKPPTTTPKVTTNWGNAKLLKVDSANPDKGLEGAEFEVYEAETSYVASPEACEIASVGSAIEFKKLNPATTTTKIVSDKDGVINVPALFVSDSEHDPKNAEFRCYVLVETQAPAGYVTPTGDTAKRAIAIHTGLNDLTVGDPIKNSRQEIPGLPLTGAQGQVLLITGGVAAAALVAGLVLVNRRRQSAAL